METIFSLTMTLGEVTVVVTGSDSVSGCCTGSSTSTSTLLLSENVEMISSTFSTVFVISSTCLVSSSVMIGTGVGGFVIVA